MNLFIFCFLAAFGLCRAADVIYSDSVVTLTQMQFFIDEDFLSPRNAWMTVDIKLEYGYPYGNKAKHSSAFVEMYGQGAQQFTIEEMQVMLENPLSYIRATAILNVKWFYDPNNTLVLQQQLFEIQESNWVNEFMLRNVSFSRNNWYLFGNYSKNCYNKEQYGFECNVLCPDAKTEIECYNCDKTNGTKKCCNSPIYDPNTCYRNDYTGPKNETCESKLSKSQADYNYQKKWRTVFFWIMIGFIVIALILLGIVFCCMFSMLYYRRRAEEQQKVRPVDEEWPEVYRRKPIEQHKVRSVDEDWPETQPAELPYTEIYRQPYKRRRPSNPPSPDIQRRRAASVATIESELRSSNFNYPLHYEYAESPRQRRRIEQLV